MKKSVVISIVIFVLLTILYNILEAKYYFIFLGILLIINLIFTMAKTRMFINKHQYCPNCNAKLIRQKKSRQVDPTNEKVHIGQTRIIGGNVKKHRWVLTCENCGYEIELNKEQK